MFELTSLSTIINYLIYAVYSCIIIRTADKHVPKSHSQISKKKRKSMDKLIVSNWDGDSHNRYKKYRQSMQL